MALADPIGLFRYAIAWFVGWRNSRTEGCADRRNGELGARRVLREGHGMYQVTEGGAAESEAERAKVEAHWPFNDQHRRGDIRVMDRASYSAVFYLICCILWLAVTD